MTQLVRGKEETTQGIPQVQYERDINVDSSSNDSIRKTDQKSQDISESIFLESPAVKTNDLYHRLTQLVKGGEIKTEETAGTDHEPTYTDAEQVRAENDGADSARKLLYLIKEYGIFLF